MQRRTVFWQRGGTLMNTKVNIAGVEFKNPVMVAQEHLVQVQNTVNL